MPLSTIRASLPSILEKFLGIDLFHSNQKSKISPTRNSSEQLCSISVRNFTSFFSRSRGEILLLSSPRCVSERKYIIIVNKYKIYVDRVYNKCCFS